MGQPFVGEIRMFAGNFAPAGWAFCDGSLVAISQNDTLFNLIGTTYGGDGQSTFALPDLRGRTPVHQGNGVVLAQTAGVETVTLTTSLIPAHNHLAQATNAGQQISPSNAILAQATGSVAGIMIYASATATVPLSPASIQNDGGSQPHDNMQPYLCVSFIISLYGIYPSPT